MKLFLVRLFEVLQGDPANVAGPYELPGTVLVALQFIFTFMMVIGKWKFVRLGSPFFAAIFGAGAFVVYYLNQTAVGNSLDFRVLFITLAGLVYGSVIGILRIKKERELQELRRSSKEAAERNYRIDT